MHLFVLFKLQRFLQLRSKESKYQFCSASLINTLIGNYNFSILRFIKKKKRLHLRPPCDEMIYENSLRKVMGEAKIYLTGSMSYDIKSGI